MYDIAIFNYINGSKFLRFLILLVFFVCWVLRIKDHPQNPQKLNPAK